VILPSALQYLHSGSEVSCASRLRFHLASLYQPRHAAEATLRWSILPLRSASACFLGLEPGALSVGGRVGMCHA
jgi:hypothetical protein